MVDIEDKIKDKRFEELNRNLGRDLAEKAYEERMRQDPYADQIEHLLDIDRNDEQN